MNKKNIDDILDTIKKDITTDKSDILDDYITVSEYAKKVGISRQATLKRIERGSIVAIRVGNYYLIKKS